MKIYGRPVFDADTMVDQDLIRVSGGNENRRSDD